VEVRATLRRSGGNEPQRVGVSFYFDGERVAQQSVSLPPDGVAVAVGRGTPKRTGVTGGYASIDDDPFEPDNRRFFAFEVPNRIRVLLAEGSPGESQYVRLSLTLGGDTTLSRLFDIATVDGSRIQAANPEGFDVLILCGVKTFSPQGAAQIARFVKAGGGLLAFPGPTTDLDVFASLLARTLDLPSFHLTMTRRTAGTGGVFGKVDRLHPLFDGMFEQRAGRKPGELFSPHVQVTAAPGSFAEGHVVMALNDGTPFLVDVRSGKGRILYCSVDARGQWSDFPLQGLFAPLLYRSVVYCARSSDIGSSQWVGRRIVGAIHAGRESEIGGFVLRSPSGELEKLPPPNGMPGGEARFAGSRSTETGVYTLLGGHGTVLSAFPVNLDTAETDLRSAPDSTILESVHAAYPSLDDVRIVNASQSLSSIIEEARYGVELWRQCAALAIVLALAEMAVGLAGRRHEAGNLVAQSGERGAL
jgi:hypothetical protein